MFIKLSKIVSKARMCFGHHDLQTRQIPDLIFVWTNEKMSFNNVYYIRKFINTIVDYELQFTRKIFEESNPQN